MPSTTKTTKKKQPKWYDMSENELVLCGEVKRIIFDSDKVVKFSLDVVSKTPKGNFSHAFITCTKFLECSNNIAEGDIVKLSGRLATDTYDNGKEKKYNTTVIVDDYTFIEEEDY